MLAYLPLLLLQPWKALSKRQRRFVWLQCIHPLLIRWPLMLAKSVILFGALMAVMLPNELHGWRQFLAFFAVIFFTTELFDMIFVACSRSKIAHYIEEHQAEIQSVV